MAEVKKDKKVPNPKGRASKYFEIIEPNLDYIYEAVFNNVSEANIAKALGSNASTFSEYKNKHEELRNVINKARRDRANKGLVTLMEFIDDKPPLDELLSNLKDKADQHWTSVNEYMNYIRFLYPDTDWYRLYKLKEIDIGTYEAMTNRMKVEAEGNADTERNEEGKHVAGLMEQFMSNMNDEGDE